MKPDLIDWSDCMVTFSCMWPLDAFTITSLYSQLFAQRHFGPFCLADILDICYLLPVTWASWYKFTGRELDRLFNRRPMLSYQFKLPSGIAPAADKWNVPAGIGIEGKEAKRLVWKRIVWKRRWEWECFVYVYVMSVMSKERNLKEWLRDFVAKETVTDTYCSIQPLSRWVAGIWYIVYIGALVRWLQPFTLLGSAWSLAVAIGNLPCVCVSCLVLVLVT